MTWDSTWWLGSQ